MVIKGEQIAPIGGKGIGLPDKLEGITGVGCEDNDIFIFCLLRWLIWHEHAGVPAQ